MTPPLPPPTALAALARRLRRQLPRTLGFTAVLCGGIAVLLSAMNPGRFGAILTYSVCIGLCCMLLTDGGRLGSAWLADRSRRIQGLPPDPALGEGWRGVWLGVLLAVLGGPLLGTWLADAIIGTRSPSLLNPGATSTRITLVVSVLATLVAVVVLSQRERLASARSEAETAKRQATEAQLRLLQSQLEPHMLFNTLANLRVLIGLDPPRAQAMLDHLNAFLRATLQASRSERHALSQEFDRLADYMALMSVRMGPRLQVLLQLPETLRQQPMPPLLLQSLVENSVHHGLEPKVAGGRVEVTATTEQRTLVLTVRDTGMGLPSQGAHREGGFGVAQVRQRLATLYGGSASLVIEPAADDEGGTRATVRLPMDPLS